MNRRALVLTALLGASTAHAQPISDQAVDLARICSSEAGLLAQPTPDCAAIAHLLIRRAALLDRPLPLMARQYSTRVFNRRRADRRAWIAWLEPNLSKPRFWPANLSWPVFRPRWRTLLRVAQGVLSGTVPDPCAPQLPDHWGGIMDDHRAHRAGWTLAACSANTLNNFWIVPRRRRR